MNRCLRIRASKPASISDSPNLVEQSKTYPVWGEILALLYVCDSEYEQEMGGVHSCQCSSEPDFHPRAGSDQNNLFAQPQQCLNPKPSVDLTALPQVKTLCREAIVKNRLKEHIG